MKFVDTNYFLRFFLKDVNEQHKEAHRLFQKAALGQEKLTTSVIVFFEIYWVAESFYKLDKKTITSFLRSILKMEFIALENREVLTSALSLYEDTSFDLEDAYNLAFATSAHAADFMTFDVKLGKKFKNITT
ncbi:MAG: PIN domain-containing protein [Patescibacteria group bacterium]